MSDEDALEKIGKGSLIIMAGFFLGTVFQYLYKMFLARSLGPESFGVFIQGLAILQSVATVALFGLELTLPRYISYYSGKESTKKIYDAVTSGFLIALFFAFLISGAMFLLSETIALQIFQEPALIEPLKIFSITIPVFVAISFVLSLFRGRKDPFYYSVISDFLWSGLILVSVLGAVLLGYGISGAAAAYLVATFLSALAALFIYLKRYDQGIEFSFSRVRKLLLFSWPLLFISIFSVLNRWFDVLMLGWLGVSADAGIYDVAFSLAGYVALLLDIVGFMFLPIISELHGKEKISQVKEIYLAATRWMVLVSLPFLAAMLIFPSEVITLLFGAEFTPAALSLSILAVGFFYRVLKGPSELTLISKGRNKDLLLGKTVMVVLIVVLNLFLIPVYGITGAAVSTLIAYLAGDTVLLWLVRRQLGSLPHGKGILKVMLHGLIASIPIIVLDQYFDPGVAGSVLLGGVFVLLYGSMLVKLEGVTEKDTELFWKLVNRRID